MKYCIDTSAWMDGWVRDYPQDVFPSLWTKLEEHVTNGAIISSEEVYIEIAKKEDGLHEWIKDRKEMLVPIESEIQEIVFELLATYPRLVDTKRNRSQADPFVIATAEHLKATVVTGERASGSLNNPKIPDVCIKREIRCISFLEMLREIGWKF
ncbi:DUF4411 family protein [Pelagicoccus sp. SDUM812005]|uniref:DUF4411 family protein n=1 Tax=Pelagicoccus sp. SDUM812005 TaxID=3041257 RepID=UPI00280CD428|nr:DUF4411 family protein [Pelagicoccus sp. SDUM812005]MDQ8182527.1 DUF4411 family protein [Pelagicoccus sp. SDUM812005]